MLRFKVLSKQFGAFSLITNIRLRGSFLCAQLQMKKMNRRDLEDPYEVARLVVTLYIALPVRTKTPRNTKLQELHEAVQNDVQHLSKSVGLAL